MGAKPPSPTWELPRGCRMATAAGGESIALHGQRVTPQQDAEGQEGEVIGEAEREEAGSGNQGE